MAAAAPSAGAPTLVVLSSRTCLPSVSKTALIPAALVIDRASGRIRSIDTEAHAIEAHRKRASDAEVEVRDLGELVLMAGLVDTHVHANEPGRTHWEGLETATRAAAAGGVTTIVDMPLNSIPPTTTVEGLRAKEEAARGKLTVDLGLWGGIIPTNLKDLAPLAEAGVCGYKLFLIESGVEEFPCVNEEQMRAAMLEIKAKAPELPVLVHAEACACDAAKALLEAHKGRDEKEYQNYLESRPPVWEEDAIRIALRLAQETQARCHIVHLSAAEALPQFREARAQGRDNVSLETCPHYLTLTADTIPAGATAYKCAPPIRGKDNQKALWAALRDGTIPMIVSDHSPCEPSLKCLESGSFAQSWGGISSLQLGLPLIFSELRAQALDGEDGGEEKGKFDLAKTVHQIHEWMSAAPARFVRFAHRKGGLFPGADADLVAFDPDGAVLVAKEMIQHRHKLTPYLGRSLGAAVRHTFVRGNEVFTATDVAGAPVKFSPQPLGERVYPQSHPKEVARLIDQK